MKLINSVHLAGTLLSAPVNMIGATFFIAVVSAFTVYSVLGDSASNTWLTATKSAGTSTIQIVYVVNPITQANQTFSITNNGYNATTVYGFSGITGLDTASSLTTGSGMSLAPGAITPAKTGEFLISALTESAIYVGTALTPSLGTTDGITYSVGTNMGSAINYGLFLGSGVFNPIWSWSSPNAYSSAALAAFTVSAGSSWVSGGRDFANKHGVEDWGDGMMPS